MKVIFKHGLQGSTPNECLHMLTFNYDTVVTTWKPLFVLLINTSPPTKRPPLSSATNTVLYATLPAHVIQATNTDLFEVCAAIRLL